jgi:predicted aminopeptidase
MSALAKHHHPWRWVVLGVLAGLLITLCGCRELAYYAQAVRGEHQILSHRKPIGELIEDPQTPEKLKRQLVLVQKLRSFAGEELKLPIDSRYLKYVDLQRPYVVWNVQAAPPFSLQPRTWWYPLVGSLDYRGYFTEAGARACAERVQADGDEVYVDGIEAYSTLGWFKDPILNTFVYHSEPELAEVIFHELGHARVFASGDTDFNEAYATEVGQEGARRWLVAEGKTSLLVRYEASLRREQQFVRLVQKTRSQLEAVYGDTLDEDGNIQAASEPPAGAAELLSKKQEILGQLRQNYAELKAEWNGDGVYDEWFTNDLNNAQLNTIANYYDYLPAFERLLWLNGGDLERFYGAVQRLADMPKSDRRRWLRELSKGSSATP